MFKFKKHIAFFYLIFFISSKLVGLHALTHNDDEHHDNCDICEYVIISNATPLVTDEYVVFEPIVFHNHSKQLFYNYSYSYVKNYTDSSLFSRPPPTV